MRIAHTLFIDIVGWSANTLDEQGRLLETLTSAVHATGAYTKAEEDRSVLPVPAGDGMALVFREDVTAPARCALELTAALQGAIPLRMGIHSGLVQMQTDIAGKENVVGEGINTAKRIMDEAEEGYILLSEQHARWLEQSERWRDCLHPFGERTAKHNLRLVLYTLSENGIGRTAPVVAPPSEIRSETAPGKKTTGIIAPAPPADDAPTIVLLRRRGGAHEDVILDFIETQLTSQGFVIFRDRNQRFRPDWADQMKRRIQEARAVVAIISPESRQSEMLPWELEQAREAFDKSGNPVLLPLFVGAPEPANDSIEAFLCDMPRLVWETPEDNLRIVAEIVSAIRGPLPLANNIVLEPVGGAVPLDSVFYVTRQCDGEVLTALDASESILLIPGARQVGKTSLLARGAQHARAEGARVVQTDFQQLNASYMAEEGRFYRGIAATLARQLHFDYDFAAEWDDFLAPNDNLNYFMESLVSAAPSPLIWCLDEADKLFPAPFASDFFGLIRSWHNARANRPDGPWKRLTLIIAYATEARLFIRDMNQSPFNVGRKLELNDFDFEQFRTLNARYGAPLSPPETMQTFALLNGQPFLSRRALDAVASGKWTFPALIASASRDDGPFHDHLQRLLLSVTHLPEVREFVRLVLKGDATANGDLAVFDRIHSAGLIRQDRDSRIDFRCELYRAYIAAHLPVL